MVHLIAFTFYLFFFFLFWLAFFFGAAGIGISAAGPPSVTIFAALYGSRKLTGFTETWRTRRLSISTSTENPIAK